MRFSSLLFGFTIHYNNLHKLIDDLPINYMKEPDITENENDVLKKNKPPPSNISGFDERYLEKIYNETYSFTRIQKNYYLLTILKYLKSNYTSQQDKLEKVKEYDDFKDLSKYGFYPTRGELLKDWDFEL
jgi:hypothetical protein